MVVEITPIGINSLGWKFYIIWTVLNGAFVPVIYLFYPETAGRALEDIDRLFAKAMTRLCSTILTPLAVNDLRNMSISRMNLWVG